MSKKVIEQEKWGDMVVLQNMNFDNKKLCVVIRDYTRMDALRGEATILDENRTTVAKAICPEYQKVIDEVEFLRAERPVNIAIRNENKTLKDQNAKLVEALDTLLTRLNKNESMSDFVIATETVRAIIDQALQNTKNIEG